MNKNTEYDPNGPGVKIKHYTIGDEYADDKRGVFYQSFGSGQYWYDHGWPHRLDGPAIIYKDGLKRWYVHSKPIPVSTQEEFESYMKLKAFW